MQNKERNYVACDITAFKFMDTNVHLESLEITDRIQATLITDKKQPVLYPVNFHSMLNRRLATMITDSDS